MTVLPWCVENPFCKDESDSEEGVGGGQERRHQEQKTEDQTSTLRSIRRERMITNDLIVGTAKTAIL